MRQNHSDIIRATIASAQIHSEDDFDIYFIGSSVSGQHLIADHLIPVGEIGKKFRQVHVWPDGTVCRIRRAKKAWTRKDAVPPGSVSLAYTFENEERGWCATFSAVLGPDKELVRPGKLCRLKFITPFDVASKADFNAWISALPKPGLVACRAP